MELTFSRFMKMLLDKLWLLLLIVIIFGLGAYSITSFTIKPKYQSQMSFMIEKLNESGTEKDISGARQIKPEYIAYTQGDTFLKEIKQILKTKHNLDISLESLKNFIVITNDNVNSSEYSITITAYSSQAAFFISDTIAEHGPDIYKSNNLLRGSQAVLNNIPRENINPVSPNVPLNTVLGVILGIIFGIFMIISIESIDNSIKDENDLIDNYEVPLLGVVYAHRVETEGGKNV